MKVSGETKVPRSDSNSDAVDAAVRATYTDATWKGAKSLSRKVKAWDSPQKNGCGPESSKKVPTSK